MSADHAASIRRSWRAAGALSVLGMGSSFPGPALPTASLLSVVESNFGIDVHQRGLAIARRLKINARHVCRDLKQRRESPRAGHSNAQLAGRALTQALDAARLRASELSYLISHTATPGQLVPPNAGRIAELLDYDGPYLELRQACTGFANALIIAAGLIASQPSAIVAIVGSETGSVFFDPLRAAVDEGQLVNMMQMGDGAAACIVAGPHDHAGGISHLYFGHIGNSRAPGFRLAAGGSDQPCAERGFPEFEHDYASVRDCGPELFRCGMTAARESGVRIDLVDRFVPHQANGRMDEVLARLSLADRARVFVNADRIGNTGSAAIWLALAELRGSMRAGECALILGAEATKHMFGGFLYTHA